MFQRVVIFSRKLQMHRHGIPLECGAQAGRLACIHHIRQMIGIPSSIREMRASVIRLSDHWNSLLLRLLKIENAPIIMFARAYINPSSHKPITTRLPSTDQPTSHFLAFSELAQAQRLKTASPKRCSKEQSVFQWFDGNRTRTSGSHFD